MWLKKNNSRLKFDAIQINHFLSLKFDVIQINHFPRKCHLLLFWALHWSITFMCSCVCMCVWMHGCCHVLPWLIELFHAFSLDCFSGCITLKTRTRSTHCSRQLVFQCYGSGIVWIWVLVFLTDRQNQQISLIFAEWKSANLAITFVNCLVRLLRLLHLGVRRVEVREQVLHGLDALVSKSQSTQQCENVLANFHWKFQKLTTTTAVSQLGFLGEKETNFA